LSRTSGTTGNLLGAGAVISCPHGGRATAARTSSNAVLLDGLPVATAADAYVITGCPHTIDRVPMPCTSVRWTADDGGPTVDGAPVLLDTTAALCFNAALVPQGPPVVVSAQREVVVR
jgi:hypothetical protein